MRPAKVPISTRRQAVSGSQQACSAPAACRLRQVLRGLLHPHQTPFCPQSSRPNAALQPTVSHVWTPPRSVRCFERLCHASKPRDESPECPTREDVCPFSCFASNNFGFKFASVAYFLSLSLTLIPEHSLSKHKQKVGQVATDWPDSCDWGQYPRYGQYEPVEAVHLYRVGLKINATEARQGCRHSILKTATMDF